MDNNPFYSALPSSDVILQAPAQQFAQGLDSLWWDCLLTHMVHGIVHDPLAGPEILSSWQPHQQNHLTLVSESGQSYKISVYNVQLDSLTRFMNTRSLRDHWSMQDHTAKVLDSDSSSGGKWGPFKVHGLAIGSSDFFSSYDEIAPFWVISPTGQFTPMENHGAMAPTMKLPSAHQPLRCTICSLCGWVKENGTRCNTSITYDCSKGDISKSSATGVAPRNPSDSQGMVNIHILVALLTTMSDCVGNEDYFQ
ncbi:hypothetical protein BKA82DRAFT_4020269 [Pisolithus tinctorius]|nr:hypothetical protein BKA82DRAFT_4020269 [Pisolithus tinctorius]